MGEEASLDIKRYSIYYFRNYLDTKIVSLFFNNNDLKLVKYKSNKRKDEYRVCKYETTVKKAKERFDAMGYGFESFKTFFRENISYADFEIDSVLDEKLGDDEDENNFIRKTFFDDNISFDKWYKSLKDIVIYQSIHGNIDYFDNNPYNPKTNMDKIILESLRGYNDTFYGLKCSFDLLCYVFRTILECFYDNENVELEFSNLQYWDYDCIEKSIAIENVIEKTIVLVEGTSDKSILEFSLSHLFPHLYDLFYFMDFEFNGAKREGGAALLSKNFKTFFYAKIKNKVIAIFDNDAQGHQSKTQLENDINNCPNNLKILTYPILNVFINYPTIASNNTIILDNINKKACSIELYLPKTFISNQNIYYPIIWESRIAIKELGKTNYYYQGVVSNKDDIKKHFFEFQKDVANKRKDFSKHNWSKMIRLLSSIVFAFK